MELAMEISIERFQNENDYIVRVPHRFPITTTNARTDSDVRHWLKQIHRIYKQKILRQNLIVGFCITSHIWNTASQIDKPYNNLFQICVENHCLLCEIDELRRDPPRRIEDKWNPIALKDFLHSGAVTVVGAGAENLVKKMEEDFGWVMPKVVELRDLAAANVLPPPRGFKRYGIARLARVVLPEEDNAMITSLAAKPSKLSWWDTTTNDTSNEMVKYATLEVFLASCMGMQLLAATLS